MSNRQIPIDDYLIAIDFMQRGHSNRAIAEAGVLGKNKIKVLRETAEQQGWSNPCSPFPSPEALNRAMGISIVPRGLSQSLPGEFARVECERGPSITNPQTGDTKHTWIFLMQLVWSGMCYAECIGDQDTFTWLACHTRAFRYFGGIPRKIEFVKSRNRILNSCFDDPAVERTYREFARDFGFQFERVTNLQARSLTSGLSAMKKQIDQAVYASCIREATGIVQYIACQMNNNWNPISADFRFKHSEQVALSPIPNPQPDIAIWSQGKVHGDGHVQFEGGLYSVPPDFIGKTVWLRVTHYLLQIFNHRWLICTHVRLYGESYRSTLKSHEVLNDLVFESDAVKRCLRQSEGIGPNCKYVVERIFSINGLRSLRGVQGLLGLVKKIGPEALESACLAALSRNEISVRKIKTLLACS